MVDYSMEKSARSEDFSPIRRNPLSQHISKLISFFFQPVAVYVL